MNAPKLRDIIILTINNKKISININEIKREYFEINKIKISAVKHSINDLNYEKTFKEHLFNFLYIYDEKIYNKSCLIKWLLDHNIKVQEIKSPFLRKKDQTLFAEFGLKPKIRSRRLPKFYFLKIISAFKKKISTISSSIEIIPIMKDSYDPDIKYDKMIRAWVELSENIYVNKLNKSLDNTIIYMNPHGSTRQKKYIDHLNENNRNYFFFNSNLSFYNNLKDGIKVIFGRYPSRLKFPILKILQQRKAIDLFYSFLKLKFPYVREFYTKEEFMPSSIYLTYILQKNGISVINYSHGLGFDGPITNYDEFYVFSKLQQNQYLGTSKFQFFKDFLPKEIKSVDKTKPIALLLIHQNLLTFSKSRTIKQLYIELIKMIERIYLDLKIPVFAKYHPNSKKEDQILSENIFIIEKIEDLPSNYNYLNITFFSTYVIELLSMMPFLIINPYGRINIDFFLPPKSLLYVKSYPEFKERILNFMNNPNYYLEYWNSLIQLIRENYY